MAWSIRKAVSAGVGIIVVMASLTASPASAEEPCDLVLNATVSGASTSGGLKLVATPSPEGWVFSATVPTGYVVSWLDGDYGVTTFSDGVSIGGGVLTRSSFIVGDFVSISACLVESSGSTGLRADFGQRSLAVMGPAFL